MITSTDRALAAAEDRVPAWDALLAECETLRGDVAQAIARVDADIAAYEAEYGPSDDYRLPRQYGRRIVPATGEIVDVA